MTGYARIAWRPGIPRHGKSMLLDARELADNYGWVDTAVAVIHAARDAGWTLQEIGDVLGVTREFVRQLYVRESSDTVVGFPVKPPRPKRPHNPPRYVRWRQLVSNTELSALIDLRDKAKRVRSNRNPEAVAAAEELYRRVAEFARAGVPVTWLSRQMGLSPRTLSFGLVRYGYAPPPPSLRQSVHTVRDGEMLTHANGVS